jgi:hypothetical protein
MTLQEAIDHFGTAYQINKAVKVSYNTVNNWKKLGYIPIHTQIKIEKATNGALKASLG